MKMKNRRSLSRTGAESETAGPDYDCDPGKRRKSTDTMRVRRKSKSPRRTHPNGSVDVRVGKKRKQVNPNETSAKFASPKTVHQSNCSSSASSVVSCPPDTVDPYEFAVKADEESTDYPSNPSYVSNSSSVPPMKMMKLDRMDDRCLSDSARSSPLSQPLFTQSSPDSHSSPLTVNCTRPLSVLTDFSSTPSCAVRRSNGDMDSNAQSSLQHHNHLQRNVPVTTSVPYPNNLNTLISRPTQSNYCSNGLSSPLTSECNTSRKSKLHTTSPMSKSSMDFCNLNPSPLGNNHTDDPDVNSPSDPSIPRPNPLAERKIRAASPTVTDSKRCVGVNTVLDTSKSTSTEPDLLGPCEPGTTICLNGIVWLETTTGVLVVNVTWRGRTYIGTLLDATQHDFAPPCPRDYIPAFKSNNMRSSNRSKRRSALNNTYRHQNNQLLSNSSDFHGKTIGANQRHRLRERNGSFPSTGDSAKRRDPHTKNDVPELTENIIDASNEIDKCRNEAGSGTISDEDVGCDSKRPKNNSDDCPASVDTDLGTTRPSGKPNNVPLNHDGGSTVDDSKKDRNDDAELHSSFPIICPIDGCQKRFTNMTALRFHLNHKRHETTSARVSTTCTTILHTSPDKKLDKRSTPDIPTSDISPVNDQHNRTDRDDLRKVSNDPSCKTSALFGSRTEQNDLPGVDSREPPSIINSGLSTELPGPHSSSRTVTAHTVSVPCGLTDVCEKSEHSVGRTNLAHSSANKQRSRIDSGKSRGPGTKTSSHTVKSESGHMGSTRCLDFAKELAEHYNLPQFNARSTVNRMENSSNGFTQLNHSLPVLSHCPTSSSLQPSNSLLSLAAGMWGFPNSNNGQTASNTYGDTRYLPPGMPPSSIFPPHFRSLTQSTLNLSNSDNSHCDSVQDHRPVSTATNSCNASMDAASLYGLPEFLMAAAMNALNPNGVSNALENANRSQIPSTAIPRTLPSASPHTNLMQTSTYSLKTSLPSGCSTTPISMAPGSSMFGGSMLPAGSLSQESLMLNPPSFHGSSSLAPSDKADPFKLSAAYLMQQAVAGSQLSSIFGQQ